MEISYSYTLLLYVEVTECYFPIEFARYRDCYFMLKSQNVISLLNLDTEIFKVAHLILLKRFRFLIRRDFEIHTKETKVICIWYPCHRFKADITTFVFKLLRSFAYRPLLSEYTGKKNC